MIEPLVSVKMLAYNHAPYIERAIEGVLCQKTDFPFELVIGEDCSTDGTREIVFDYAQRHPDIIRVITSDCNVGMHRNVARTSAALRGTYIAWCEGDDYWHRPDKLQVQVDYLEAHPECGLVCSDFDLRDTASGDTKPSVILSNPSRYVTDPDIKDILRGRGGVLTCTAVARRRLVEDIAADDPYLHNNGPFLMGDTQLWAEISLRASIHRIPESLATHNLLSESATRSCDRAKVLRFWLSNSQMCLYLCKKYDMPLDIQRSHAAIVRRKSLQLAFLENNVDLAGRIRKAYPDMSSKDTLWYLATRVKAVRPMVRFLLAAAHRHTSNT